MFPGAQYMACARPGAEDDPGWQTLLWPVYIHAPVLRGNMVRRRERTAGLRSGVEVLGTRAVDGRAAFAAAVARRPKGACTRVAYAGMSCSTHAQMAQRCREAGQTPQPSAALRNFQMIIRAHSSCSCPASGRTGRCRRSTSLRRTRCCPRHLQAQQLVLRPAADRKERHVKPADRLCSLRSSQDRVDVRDQQWP